MNKKRTSLVSILLIIVALAVVLPFVNIPSLTVLSVDTIYIDPQTGSEDPTTHEWKGSSWVIVMTADMNDQLTAYKFDDSEAKSGDYFVDGANLTVTSEITIQIDPQQPYYARQMEIKSVEMSPHAYQNYRTYVGTTGKDMGIQISAKYTGHYEFTTDSRWEKHTPFIVKVLKNGVEIGSILMDTDGGSQDVTISTGEGDVLIKNLGSLSGVLGEPTFNDILYFTDSVNHGVSNIFLADTTARTLITNSYPTHGETAPDHPTDCYATYWFGAPFNDWHWTDDGTPKSVWVDETVGFNEFGGWTDGGSDGWTARLKPVAPTIWDKSNLPLDKRGFQSLVEYLAYKNVKKVTTTGFTGVWKREDNKLQVDVPFSAVNEGSSLFTIMIPTDLADTIVWQPPVSDIKIVEVDFPEKAKYPDGLGELYKGSITLRQDGNVRSSGTVSITFDPQIGLIATPNSFDATLDPGETRTYDVAFLNTGNDEVTDVTVKVEINEAFAGAQTDYDEYIVTLAVRGEGSTVLTVFTQDATDKTLVSNIHVYLSYESLEKDGYTLGGVVSFDMGTYTGTVTATSSETDLYRSASETTGLEPGSNTVYLMLTRKDVPLPSGFNWLPWLIVVGLALVVVFGVLKKRRRKAW